MRRAIFILGLLIAVTAQASTPSPEIPAGKGPTTTRRLWLQRAACAAGVAGLAGSWWFGLGGEQWASGPDSMQTAGFEKEPTDQRLDIFVMGDSLSCGDMSYTSGAGTILSTRMRTQKCWPLSGKTDSLNSLYERLSPNYPTRVTNAAWAGAYLDGASPLDRTTANRLGNIHNFSDQITRFLQLPEKPNLVLIWVGHNNLDWIWDVAKTEGLEEQSYYDSIPKRMSTEMVKDLERIRQKASGQRSSVVVYGLVNFRHSVAARDVAEKLRASDPALYPYFDVPKSNFPSTNPEHSERLIQLGINVNIEMKRAVEAYALTLNENGQNEEFSVRYSDAIYDTDLSAVENIHPLDGFHLSEKGHGRIAESVEADIVPSIQFLRIERLPQ